MARKTKAGKNNLPGMFKNMLGVQAKPVNTDQVPPGYEKIIQGIPVKAMSTTEVLASAGKDLMSSLGTWWKEGLASDEEDVQPAKKSGKSETAQKLIQQKIEKDATVKKADKQTLGKLTDLYTEGNNILSKILSEISLLRKLTEGSVKFEK